MLENRLDKAVIKFNEAQSIRKTYDQIVKKLKDERLTFDAQLYTLEKLVKTKQEELNSLNRMFNDANHAKEVAKVSAVFCMNSLNCFVLNKKYVKIKKSAKRNCI